MVSFDEAQMKYNRYPLDQQNFSIILQSYSLDSKMVAFEFYSNPPVSFTYDYQQKTNYVEENQLWDYVTNDAFIANNPSPTTQNPSRSFATMYINIVFKRQSLGIIYRLAVPVCIFLCIVGFSFWADIDKRIDVTLNILLVVSALYIIIGQIIPFVGYLSVIDWYITIVFILLSLTIAIHFTTIALDEKQVKYPLALLMKDIMLFIFRSIWIPLALIMLVMMFDIRVVFILCMMYVGGIASILNAIMNIGSIFKSLRATTLFLREKKKRVIALQERLKEHGKISEEEYSSQKKTGRRLNYLEKLFLWLSANWYKDEEISMEDTEYARPQSEAGRFELEMERESFIVPPFRRREPDSDDEVGEADIVHQNMKSNSKRSVNQPSTAPTLSPSSDL